MTIDQQQMPGLGRIASPDERDRRHLLRSFIPTDQPRPRSKTWRIGQILDQGQTGTCVGHGWRAKLSGSPVRVKLGVGPDAMAIYKGACLNDEWSDNDDGDLQAGSSVRGGAKYLANLGYVGEYAWAFDLQTAVDYVLFQAPVVLGVTWYDSMFAPDDEGIIRIKPHARVAGGHCLLMYGVDTRKGMARLQNSWGTGWAKKGCCWLPLEDLDRLIQEDGEACDAVELVVPK
jgi:hypothetical protein